MTCWGATVSTLLPFCATGRGCPSRFVSPFILFHQALISTLSSKYHKNEVKRIILYERLWETHYVTCPNSGSLTSLQNNPPLTSPWVFLHLPLIFYSLINTFLCAYSHKHYIFSINLYHIRAILSPGRLHGPLGPSVWWRQRRVLSQSWDWSTHDPGTGRSDSCKQHFWVVSQHSCGFD